jgi:hypothetical protein
MGRVTASFRKRNAAKPRRISSRLAKRQLVDRLRRDTELHSVPTIANSLRKLGFEELPLDELQDRLSKVLSPLAESILKARG